MTSEYEAAVVELAERIMALCTDEKNDVDVVLDAMTHALLTVCEDKRNTELVSGDILPLNPPRSHPRPCSAFVHPRRHRHRLGRDRSRHQARMRVGK